MQMPTDMTKREYYAAVALSGLLAGRDNGYRISDSEKKDAAADAVKIADELLAQLEEPAEQGA
jgi:hypothetical protein